MTALKSISQNTDECSFLACEYSCLSFAPATVRNVKRDSLSFAHSSERRLYSQASSFLTWLIIYLKRQVTIRLVV